METTSDADGLSPLIEGFHAAIDEEIAAIQDDLARRGLDRPLAATGGRGVDAEAAGYLYDWSLPSGRYAIRVDDAVRVSCEAGDALGFVTAFEPATRALRVAVSEWLGRRPGSTELTFDPTWLLGALSARLRSLEEDPRSFHASTALRLFGRRWPETGERDADPVHADGLNPSQQEALARILGSRTQLVWGPPGTGKTRLLARAAVVLAAEGPVLVLATTNVAIDEASRRIAAQLGESAVRDGRIVRLGAELSPTGEAGLSLRAAVQRRENRSPSALTRLLTQLETELGGMPSGRDVPSLWSRFAHLTTAARRTGTPGVAARLGHVALAFQRAAARALREADLVLTTFARLTLRDDVWALRFKSVLVDEASTVPLPDLFAGASLASERAVAVGDFQQLPAVVASRGENARRWLATNIFQEAGVIAPGEGRDLPGERDALCAMLDVQYRMAPAIRSLVSDLFYGGRLTDSPEVGERRVSLPPLVLVETGPLSPRPERAEGSRANEAHLNVVLQLLEMLARRGVSDVGLVTPYRLQARRLRRSASRRLGRTAPGALEVATIHRFQGREKSVVILDTVDAPPAGSWFLNEARNHDFPRLLNVALSRGRDSVILVGTSVGLARTLPAGSLLLRVLDHVSRYGLIVDASKLLTEGDAALRV